MRRAATAAAVGRRAKSVNASLSGSGTKKEEGRFYTVAGKTELYPSVTTVLGVINKPKLQSWMKTQVLNFVRARLNTLLHAEDEEETITGRTGGVTITKEWVEQTIREADVGPTAVADAAAQFGKASHTIIERSIKRVGVELGKDEEEEEVDPRYAVMVQNYHSWLAQSGLEIKEAEKFVWSETHRYAGSLDAWGVCTGQDGRQRLVVVDWKTTNNLQPQHAMQVAAYAKALGEMTGTPVDEGWVVKLDKTKLKWQAKKVANLDETFEHFLGALSLWRGLKTNPYVKLTSPPSPPLPDPNS